MHDHMHTILIGFGRSYRVRQKRWRVRDTGDRHLSPILTVAANFVKEIACENEALKFQADEAQTCLDRDPEKMAVLDYPGGKIYLKEDDEPILFPLVEAMLTPSIRRTRMQLATRAVTTSLGSKANGPRKWAVTDTVSAIFYFLTLTMKTTT